MKGVYHKHTGIRWVIAISASHNRTEAHSIRSVEHYDPPFIMPCTDYTLYR